MGFHSQLLYIWAMPLTANLLMTLIAILLLKKTPCFSRFLFIFSFISLWLLSTPLLSQLLIKGLENQYPPLAFNELKHEKGLAIVVLGGGDYADAPEYMPHYTVNIDTLGRLRYAILLHNKTGSPLLTSGADINRPAYSHDMKKVAETEFHTPIRWEEARGANTAQEAVFTKNILEAKGIKKIYLVTDAWHMPRAVFAYQKAGFEVIPAPTQYLQVSYKPFEAFLPSTEMLEVSTVAMHEYVGLIWYHLLIS